MLKTLHGRFLETSRACWNKKMSIDANTETELTYGKGVIAARLLSKIVKSKTNNKYVGVLLPSCGGCILAVFGTLFSNKIPAMINYSTGVLSNISIVKKKCNVDLILTSRKFIEKLGIEATKEMLFLEDMISSVSTFDKIISLITMRFLPISMVGKIDGWSDDDCETLVILFTSGSEKEPKAVQLTHSNVLTNVNAISKHMALDSGEVLLGTLPMFHSFGFISFCLFVNYRMKIVFYPNPLDYKTIGEKAKEYSATVILGTPTFYEGYISKCKKDDFTSIKIAISGGDKLLKKTQTRFEEKFGIEILQGYGVTECAAAATINSHNAKREGSIGKPLPSMKVKIINPETGKDVGTNKEGLIIIKGDNVMLGYLGDEEKTQEAIKDSWYYTGDIGRLDDDGFLWFSGRVKRFVKIGGEMISLVMVEAAISECIPDEYECAVIGTSDEKRGSRIHAFLTIASDALPPVKNKLKKTLPPIAMPKEFHIIDEIPKFGTGKPNFRELEKLLDKASSATV